MFLSYKQIASARALLPAFCIGVREQPVKIPKKNNDKKENVFKFNFPKFLFLGLLTNKTTLSI